MELSMMLASQIMSMMLMILIGYVIAKTGLVDLSASAVLSALSLYVFFPCLLFSAWQIEFSLDKLKGIIIGFVAAIFVHILFIPLSKFLARFCPMTDTDRASVIYGNAGNLIVPLLAAILGQEFVFYSSAFLAVQTVLLWTHGKKLVTGEGGSIKKVLLNPCIIAICAGMLFFLLPIRLPSVIMNSIDKLGSCIGPVSMITIGIIMSQMPIKEAFKDLHTYKLSAIRLVIMPVLLVILLWASRVTFFIPLSARVLIATVLASCGPTASTVSQTARVYGKDALGVSMTTVMSTLFCIFTMPLVLYLYQLLCVH